MNKLIIFILLFLTCINIFARDVTVKVIDSDLDLPLEGAVVRERDGNEYKCNKDGIAVIKAPDDRQFVIYISYPGYETNTVVVPVSSNSIEVFLHLSGVIQGKELVLEAQKPGASESRTGRSVAISGREIAQSAEIGIIEDVMSAIKLLPGVGYTGIFNAQPSIRGGFPGDMGASLDGFYIRNPYFWGGGFSIFDPNMVQSAQLSHGVFSVRYGHTISGLLEIVSKDPSPTDTQFELGANSSTANFNLSLPLMGKGGILFIGRVTYYDPVVFLAKQLTDVIPELSVANYIRQAPYIRSAILTGNYRFTSNLELRASAFIGMDGLSAFFENKNRTDELNSDTFMDMVYTNFKGFFTSGISWNPRNDMLLKLTMGTGFEEQKIDGEIENNILDKHFSDEFKTNNSVFFKSTGQANDSYNFYNKMEFLQSVLLFNAQGRIDYDWKLGDYLLISAGVQEMYNLYRTTGDMNFSGEIPFTRLGENQNGESFQTLLRSRYPEISANDAFWDKLRVRVPIQFAPELENNLFTTSAFLLGEFNTSGSRLKAELGLRLDHFYLMGKGFSVGSEAVLNPRVNIDINILKNISIFDSLDLSLGTGLFSSINDNVFYAEERYEIFEMKPNRSWTSILGIRFSFPESLSLNIEGYYKQIFDRMYIPIGMTLEDSVNIQPQFDGMGTVWGLDIMLHKVQSRFWDGWISYSYNWTKYHDPQGIIGIGFSGGYQGSDWYYPQFHRFHNLNLVFNFKPVQNINIYLRFGYASGVQLTRPLTDKPESHPVLIYEEGKIIEKYYWESAIDENNRTTSSIPMDIKFSIYGSNKSGKARYEVYVAVENVLALLYTAQGNTSFNQYTGEVDTGSNSASYELPIPVPSFGFKLSY